MFTVILLSQTAQRRYAHWKEIFLPFIEDGQIAVTEWANPNSATSLTQAVPGLVEAVKGHSEWRLLVIGTGSEGGIGEDRADPANPFDFAGNWTINQPDQSDPWSLHLNESPYPIVRLTHLVMGYPEMGTKTFFPDPSYWDQETRSRIYASEFIRSRGQEGVSAEEAKREFEALLPTKHDVQTHYHQDDYSEEEQRAYRKLAQKYQVHHSKPSELVLLAIREPLAPKPREELRDTWDQGAVTTLSRFAQRNDYHPAARFVLFERPAETHSGYDLSELRFWLSALTIAINDVPPSSLQAERQYRVDVEVSPQALSSTLNLHLGRLTSARDHLEKEIRRPKAMTRLDVEEVLEPRQVLVSFEHLSGDEMNVPIEGYGLARDKPNDEMGRWNEAYLQLDSAVEVFNRKPKRVLAKAVEETREARHAGPVPSEPMTRIEREELEEELANRAQALALATTRDILDKRRLDRVLATNRSRIRAAINQRMRSGTIWLGSGLVAFVWLAAYLPFLIQSFTGGFEAIVESFIVVLAILFVLFIIGWTVLLFMRKVLIDKLKEFNRDLKNYVNSVKAGASAFADFLSGIETYMYGRAILDEQDRQELADKRRTLQLHSELDVIKAAIAREKSLIKSVGQPVEIRRLTQGATEFEPWRLDSLSRLLTFPVTAGQCEFNSTGEYVNAPFSFVERLLLSSTALREDVTRQRILLDEINADHDAEAIDQ